MPEEEELLQESEVHHNDVDVDKDDQMEDSYDDPPEKKTCRGKLDRRWLEADEILISAVQMRPCLWNYTIDVKERTTLKVRDAWCDVLKELKDYKFTVEDVKKRWRNLQDSFNKAKKKKNTYLPSGSAAPTTSDDSNFRHYDNMLFLIDKLKSRRTTSNISQMSHSCDSNEAPSTSTALDVDAIEESMIDFLGTSGRNSNISENNSFIDHTKRNDTDDTVGPKTKHEDNEFQKQLVNIISECNKPANGFLLHLGDILQRLPYKERRTLEKEILDLAYKAEEKAQLITS
ncbi:uncharacterized protein [Temnothorax longispinosus]|uniref:uncharacterized protein isoform X1 n=1 Tax=Temnothorax longispinosus TaxID=300112 RepID=UPI003A9A2E84